VLTRTAADMRRDDAATLRMLVEFDDGSLYEYAPVPASVWSDVVAAQPHPWSRVGNPLPVQGGVTYRKIRGRVLPVEAGTRPR
jgi:hypothetical protein